MKLFLTGLPKSGKTTLLTHLIADITPKRGMAAKEAKVDGTRIGFDLVDEQGNTAKLARVDEQTEYQVSRYFVDVPSLDVFIERLATYEPDELLFIDEIGQMQLFSAKFRQLVDMYLDTHNDVIGTISAVYEDPFIARVAARPDILLFTVTPDNRVPIIAAASEALAHRELFNKLDAAKQRIVLDLARTYLAAEQYVSLRKLFRNALDYVVEGAISQTRPNEFGVQGRHGAHIVRRHDAAYECDCDLFNGRGQFAQQAGECSHIQAVKIAGAQ